MPGVPALLLRPAQPSPDEQVPVPLVPQQIWSAAPHAAHWLPPAATTQPSPLVHGDCPGQHC
jgi:hypothetical protein